MYNEDDLKFINKKNKLYTFIWLFLLAELAGFFTLFYLYLVEVPKETLKSNDDFNTIFLYLSYVAVIISVPLAYKIYDNRKKQASKIKSLKQNTEKYFLTMMIIYSLFEFAAIMTLIAFYLTKMYQPLYMFGIMFVAVLLNKPSLQRFLNKALENREEHTILEDTKQSDEENDKKNQIK